jgi:hypothetical protein
VIAEVAEENPAAARLAPADIFDRRWTDEVAQAPAGARR